MKVLLPLFLILAFFKANPHTHSSKVKPNISVIPYQWFLAFCSVESSNNPKAYNKRGKAHGIVQIRKGAIQDINNKFGTSYKIQDAYSIKKSWEIFQLYIKLYSKSISIKRTVQIWRYGPFSKKKFLHRGYYTNVIKNINKIYVCQNQQNLQEMTLRT